MLNTKCLDVFFLSLLFFWLQFGVKSVSSNSINGTNIRTKESKSLVHFGLIYDSNSPMGVMAELALTMALWDFYSVHSDYRTRLVLHTKHSEDLLGAASSAVELLKNEKVKTIMVAQRPNEAKFVAELGGKAHVPIISFTARSPRLLHERNPYFIRTSQNDFAQVKAIANVVKGLGWHEVIFLYEDSVHGTKFIPLMVDALEQADISVRYTNEISLTSEDFEISNELNRLMKMETRVFLVHATPSLGAKLFALAKKAGMMSEGYSWIITSELSNLLNTMNSSVIDSMEGVLGIRPYVPKSKNLENFKMRWKRNLHWMKPNSTLTTELNIFGLWAYDATWALAMSVERIGHVNFGFEKVENATSSSDIMNFRLSEVGPRLANEIIHTSFNGLSGEFGYLDGQLQTSAFEVLNIIGNGERIVGYWTPNKGISRELYSKSTKGLKNIIWPGDSMVKPIGWAIPIIGNKMRIGVPYKKGFTEFVNVERIPGKNQSFNITGYSIDVFNATLKTLPFKVDVEFIPFMNNKNESNGTYNELLQQIPNKTFDAVVGDITIVADRAAYVDFTLPYTESVVTKVVRIKHDKRRNMWIFLEPFTWELWLTTFASCIFIGLVVQILEYNLDDDDAADSDFKGPTHQQLGMLFWFPLSVVAFPERKMVASNWSRFVLVIWLCMTFILMQSFTANLSSILTVDQLQPVVPKHSYIGYQRGTFVKDLLVKGLKLEESKLKSYDGADEYNEALSKGSQNGGVDAIYDEIPYIKLFLHQYPSKFMMSGPTYKTDGFAFAFPLGSRLVTYISKAILNVTQGEDMQKIEERNFGYGYSSSDQVLPMSPHCPGLAVHSFGGLFIIVGSATILALICSTTLWGQRFVELVKHYIQKCSFSSHSNRMVSDSRVHSLTDPNIVGDLALVENTQENPCTNSSLNDGILENVEEAAERG